MRGWVAGSIRGERIYIGVWGCIICKLDSGRIVDADFDVGGIIFSDWFEVESEDDD